MDSWRLNGSNYPIWSFRLKMELARKNLSDMINLVRLSEQKADPDFNTKNGKAMGIIVSSIDNNQLKYVENEFSAYHMWEKLRQHYEGQTDYDRTEAENNYVLITWTDEAETAEDYIDRFKKTAQRYRNLGGKPTDQQLVIRFLSSLPPRLKNLRRTLSLKEEWKDKPDEIYKFLIREESYDKADDQDQLAVIKQNKSENVFRASHGRKKKETSLSAEHRDKKTFRQKSQQREMIKCTFCNRTGHIAKYCHKRIDQLEDKEVSNGAKNESSNYSTEYLFSASSVNNEASDEQSLAASSDLSTGAIIIDTGATCHMTGEKDCLFNVAQCKKTVTTANGEKVKCNRIGELLIKMRGGGHMKLRHVVYVPDMPGTLVSARKLMNTTEGKCNMLVTNEACTVYRNKEIIAKANYDPETKLYTINGRLKVYEAAGIASTQDTALIWHLRLGHLSYPAINQLKKASNGLPDINFQHKSTCDGCIRGKMSLSSHPKEATRKDWKIGELIHTDIAGPMSIESRGGSKYYIVFVDQKTGYTWTYFMKSKSEVPLKIEEFLKNLKSITGGEASVKVLRSDYEQVYKSEVTKKLLDDYNIKPEWSAPYSHWQNGTAERMIRTLTESGRAMMIQSQMSKIWWAEAVATATFIRNRVLNHKDSTMTPYEAMTGYKPNIRNLKIFGSRCYRHVPKELRSKWDPKASECIFIGYSENAKAYKVWDISASKAVVSTEVKFDEMTNHEVNDQESDSSDSDSDQDEISKPIPSRAKSITFRDPYTRLLTYDKELDTNRTEYEAHQNSIINSHFSKPYFIPPSSPTETILRRGDPKDPPPVCKSTRNRIPKRYY
jgi:hypothetical protein